MSTQTIQTTKSSVQIRRLVLTGLFAALIYLFTSIFKIPTGQGYTHAGDGMIFLAASILPAPYAVAAGAIGGGERSADVFSPQWASVPRI